jgi:hypothetical protein
MKSLTRSRAATVSALALVLSVGIAAGCGGGDSSGGPEDAFVGDWFAESADTGFTVTCTDPVFGPVFSSGNNQLQLFLVLKFEHGVLTDLAETSGSCGIMNYDIKGDAATIVTPDPYRTGTDTTAACTTGLPLTDMAGYPIPADIRLKPDVSWTVKRLPDKTAAGADRIQLSGTASARLRADDGTGTGNVLVSNPECTYGGMDTFFRLTRP